MLLNVFNTLKFIVTHPMSKGRQWSAFLDWLRWQVGSRLVPGSVSVPYVNDSFLLVEPGMTGATGNIYVGLAEFEDMAFLLHFLRPNDLFIDIGANIGSYTVLASKSVGAKTIAFEAFPGTYETLMRNIHLNHLAARVDALNIALGETDGNIHFTKDLDTMNHVVTDDLLNGNDTCIVPSKKLDDVLNGAIPQLIKIDVEGFETPVIRGASSILKSSKQHAVIMELNGCGKRYGYSDSDLHLIMIDFGYLACRYNPFNRHLSLMEEGPLSVGNTIYVKKIRVNEVVKILRDANPFHLKAKVI